MTRLIEAIAGALRRGVYREPPVHFHAGEYEDHPEVCYDADCMRPRLSVS